MIGIMSQVRYRVLWFLDLAYSRCKSCVAAIKDLCTSLLCGLYFLLACKKVLLEQKHLMESLLVKDFNRLYVLNLWMEVVYTCPDVRYWSEILCCTIPTHEWPWGQWTQKKKNLVEVFTGKALFRQATLLSCDSSVFLVVNLGILKRYESLIRPYWPKLTSLDQKQLDTSLHYSQGSFLSESVQYCVCIEHHVWLLCLP